MNFFIGLLAISLAACLPYLVVHISVSFVMWEMAALNWAWFRLSFLICFFGLSAPHVFMFIFRNAPNKFGE